MSGCLLGVACAGAPVDPLPQRIRPAPADSGEIRIVTIGSTKEGHAVTRGHNRKFFRVGGWSYVAWIEQLGGLGDFRPLYRASRDLVTWTPPRPLSGVRNGGASGIDFEVIPPPKGAVDDGAAGDGAAESGHVIGLEAHYDDSLGRAWQYLRAYSARGGELTPEGEPVPVGAAGSRKAPPGYGSVTRDPSGDFWIAERDEKGVAGLGENALLLYHAFDRTSGHAGSGEGRAGGDRAGQGAARFEFDPKVERPFAAVAPARPGVTRAARVLCHGPFVVLVAYVEGPAGRGTNVAGLYVRTLDRRSGSWGETLTIAPAGAIVTDAPRLAPDVRPSAWIGRGGRLFVAWMPASSPRTIAVSLLDAPYSVVSSTSTAVAVPEGRRPISAQIRIDSRFDPPRAYLFAISGNASAANPMEIAPGFLFSRFDGTDWTPAESFGPERNSCLYLGMAQPELTADDDPLVALTQDAWGADMQVRLIDASPRKFGPVPEDQEAAKGAGKAEGRKP